MGQEHQLQQANDAQVRGRLDIGVLHSPFVCLGWKRDRCDVRKLPVGRRELRIDVFRFGRSLPAGAGDRMRTPDPVADVREERVLSVGLDPDALRVLGPSDVQEPEELVVVAGT